MHLKELHMRLLLPICLLLLTVGCTPDNVRNFDIRNLAKSDIDMVADTHRAQIDSHIRELAVKLYKRNPRELSKTPRMTIELRVQQIMAPHPAKGYPELRGLKSEAALELALSPEFRGDRVFALLVGIHSMIDNAFGNKQEFFLLDELDQQKLFNSARNLETVAWQLSNRRGEDGELLFLTNGIGTNGVQNLSFERLFGKMIALQDMLATIIADSTNRTIKNVVHSAASMTFLPI